MQEEHECRICVKECGLCKTPTRYFVSYMGDTSRPGPYMLPVCTNCVPSFVNPVGCKWWYEMYESWPHSSVRRPTAREVQQALSTRKPGIHVGPIDSDVYHIGELLQCFDADKNCYVFN